MKNNVSIITFGLLAAVALALGYFVGSDPGGSKTERAADRAKPAAPAATATPVALAPPAESDTTSRDRSGRVADGDIVSVFEEIAEIDGMEGQNKAWLDLVAALDAKGAERLVDLFFNKERDVKRSDMKFPSSLDPQAFISVIDRWVELDPDRVLEVFKERLSAEDMERDRNFEELSVWVMAAFGERDPEKALKFLDGLEESLAPFAAEMRPGILIGTSRQDPERALRMAADVEGDSGMTALTIYSMLGARTGEYWDTLLGLEMEDEEMREEVLSGVFFAWGATDPAAAFAAAAALEDEPERPEWMIEILQTWVKRDPLAAIEAWKSIDPKLGKEWGDDLVYEWGNKDPAGALRWAAENAPDLLESNFNSLSIDMNPAEAAKIYAGHSEERRQKISVSPRFLHRYVRQDPLAALGWMAEFEIVPKSGIEIGNSAGQALASRGADAISAALKSTPAGDVRQGMLRSVFEHAAYEDPEMARGLLQALPESERAIAMTGIVMGWAENDPQAAATFANTEGNLEIVNAVVVRWASDDPEATSKFISDRMEPGALRDQAVKSLVAVIGESDKDSAADWLRTISDEATKDPVPDALDPEE